MSFSISQLSNILKLASSSPAEAKNLIKLLSVDVNKSLEDGNYILKTPNNKELTAYSQKPLQEGSKYWMKLGTKAQESTVVTKFILQPALLKEMQNSPLRFDVKELHELLSGKKTLDSFKNQLTEHLANATSKEDFTQLSNLMLSLMQNTLTLPLVYEQFLGVFQMKKRYNKKIKKSQLDFYAALNKLGPISGTVMDLEDGVAIHLDVAFMATKLFLEEHLKDIKYKVTLHVSDDIEPLFISQTNSLLDINV
jgi:cysteinyl-tRNA synthetase